MPHVALLGDSIFDNGAYVESGKSVIDVLRKRLPPTWEATLLARDGSVVLDVGRQLAELPTDVTHILISCGGNDALGQVGLLQQQVSTIFGAMQHLTKMQATFDADYQWMLSQAMAKNLPVAVCTIYDTVPCLEREVLVTLSLFNDVISRRGISLGIPLMDLRVLLDKNADYSRLSPLEPSAQGSEKIAQTICNLLEISVQKNASSQVFGRKIVTEEKLSSPSVN